MKHLLIIAVLVLLTGCNSDASKQQKFFTATDSKRSSLLVLSIKNNQFYGQYKVQYAESIIDSGEVRGVVIGDTLKGRFTYISYGGAQEVKPFLLLKRGDTLKLGSGSAYTYLKIPYYLQESIQFKENDFQFLPIDEDVFRRLDVNMK